MKSAAAYTVVLLVSLASACGPHLSSPPTAAEVLSQGRSKLIGWANVEDAIYRDPLAYEYVMGEICDGSREWLQVAAEMRTAGVPGAEFSESLSSAVGAALPKAPESVLQLFGHTACVHPDSLPPKCNVDQWEERSTAALSRVPPSLQTEASQCEKYFHGQ